MSVRQVYYQCGSQQVIEDNRWQDEAVGNGLVDAHTEGLIPWEWIEDRLWRPSPVAMWEDMNDFAEDMLDR